MLYSRIMLYSDIIRYSRIIMYSRIMLYSRTMLYSLISFSSRESNPKPAYPGWLARNWDPVFQFLFDLFAFFLFGSFVPVLALWGSEKSKNT